MRVLIVEDEPNLGRQLRSTLEGAGYAVDLASQHELHFEPELLVGYDCIVFVGHDEYWTWEMRDAALASDDLPLVLLDVQAFAARDRRGGAVGLRLVAAPLLAEQAEAEAQRLDPERVRTGGDTRPGPLRPRPRRLFRRAG